VATAMVDTVGAAGVADTVVVEDVAATVAGAVAVAVATDDSEISRDAKYVQA